LRWCWSRQESGAAAVPSRLLPLVLLVVLSQWQSLCLCPQATLGAKWDQEKWRAEAHSTVRTSILGEPLTQDEAAAANAV
jgi:hypothetical protein